MSFDPQNIDLKVHKFLPDKVLVRAFPPSMFRVSSFSFSRDSRGEEGGREYILLQGAYFSDPLQCTC